MEGLTVGPRRQDVAVAEGEAVADSDGFAVVVAEGLTVAVAEGFTVAVAEGLTVALVEACGDVCTVALVEAAGDVFVPDFVPTQPVKAATIRIAINISPTFFICGLPSFKVLICMRSYTAL